MTTQPNHRHQSSRSRAFFLPILLACLLVALVVGGVFAWRWMQKPTSFPISHVVVQGELTHITPQALEKTITSQLTGGFFSLNLEAIKTAVLVYPWIESVSFRRVWPDTLRVRLEEQKPLARFGVTGVLNIAGHVFYPDSKTIPADLPLLEGPVDEAASLTAFYQNATVLAKFIGLTIHFLSMDPQHGWVLQLSNEVIVKMGRQDVLNRFKRFVAIYPKIVASSKETLVSVDLRYPDGFAVRFSSTLKTLKK
ncbi:MAG: FtsQ-type POTRA domain-containing protein [Coxiellaceae bacterium]|nr:FtsQ-type POTRA domain-containing protein [Coxiellaceae bacterium]